MNCEACGLEINDKIITHHISYFPEITVAVHKSCHTMIHSNNHPELLHLRPSKNDVTEFYGIRQGTQLIVEIAADLHTKLKIEVVQ